MSIGATRRVRGFDDLCRREFGDHPLQVEQVWRGEPRWPRRPRRGGAHMPSFGMYAQIEGAVKGRLNHTTMYAPPFSCERSLHRVISNTTPALLLLQHVVP